MSTPKLTQPIPKYTVVWETSTHGICLDVFDSLLDVLKYANNLIRQEKCVREFMIYLTGTSSIIGHIETDYCSLYELHFKNIVSIDIQQYLTNSQWNIHETDKTIFEISWECL